MNENIENDQPEYKGWIFSIFGWNNETHMKIQIKFYRETVFRVREKERGGNKSLSFSQYLLINSICQLTISLFQNKGTHWKHGCSLEFDILWNVDLQIGPKTNRQRDENDMFEWWERDGKAVFAILWRSYSVWKLRGKHCQRKRFDLLDSLFGTSHQKSWK